MGIYDIIYILYIDTWRVLQSSNPTFWHSPILSSGNCAGGTHSLSFHCRAMTLEAFCLPFGREFNTIFILDFYTFAFDVFSADSHYQLLFFVNPITTYCEKWFVHAQPHRSFFKVPPHNKWNKAEVMSCYRPPRSGFRSRWWVGDGKVAMRK